MSVPLFASLSAGMLARKGEAQPSKEPSFGHKPWQPPVVPAPAPPTVRAIMPPEPEGELDVAKMKVQLQDVTQVWPAGKAVYPSDNEGVGWVPNRPQTQLNLGSLGVPFKTTIRLTHAQARAVKLAALILDKPQQEILTAGLIERLEALACADLSKCSCFQSVLAGLKPAETLTT
ncbi:MAG: hypothetical protein ABMA14_17690 [Hyphomonadaceae bacterium]